MNRHDGKAKLVEDFKPLYSKNARFHFASIDVDGTCEVHRTNRELHPVTSVAREIKCKGQEYRTQKQFHKRRESRQIDDEGAGSCGSEPTVGFVAAEQK